MDQVSNNESYVIVNVESISPEELRDLRYQYFDIVILDFRPEQFKALKELMDKFIDMYVQGHYDFNEGKSTHQPPILLRPIYVVGEYSREMLSIVGKMQKLGISYCTTETWEYYKNQLGKPTVFEMLLIEVLASPPIE